MVDEPGVGGSMAEEHRHPVRVAVALVGQVRPSANVNVGTSTLSRWNTPAQPMTWSRRAVAHTSQMALPGTGVATGAPFVYAARVHPVGEGLPVLVFDDTTIPREHQFEVFHQTTAPIFDTWPLGGAASTHATATDYLVEDLVVSRLSYGPQVLRRTIHHTTGDCVGVLLFQRGGLRGRIGDDTTLDIDVDHVAVVDLGRAFTGWSDDTDVTWLAVPRAYLDPTTPLPSGGVATFHRRSPRGRLLVAAVEHLWADVATAGADEARDLAWGMVEAVRSVLRVGDFAPDGRSLLLALKDHMASNLADHSLGPASLQSACYCSRSTVYRLFQPEGGIADYIRDQRLLRCFDELTHPTTWRVFGLRGGDEVGLRESEPLQPTVQGEVRHPAVRRAEAWRPVGPRSWAGERIPGLDRPVPLLGGAACSSAARAPPPGTVPRGEEAPRWSGVAGSSLGDADIRAPLPELSANHRVGHRHSATPGCRTGRRPAGDARRHGEGSTSRPAMRRGRWRPGPPGTPNGRRRGTTTGPWL